MNHRTNPEHVIVVDCDDTLVMWNNFESVGDVYITDPYDDTQVLLKKHKKHIKLVKDHFERGYYVVVWSAGGFLWAKAVVEALELGPYVHHIMAKPLKFIDDLQASEILGTRVYLEDADEI